MRKLAIGLLMIALLVFGVSLGSGGIGIAQDVPATPATGECATPGASPESSPIMQVPPLEGNETPSSDTTGGTPIASPGAEC